ncbi:MAG: hypothetical protein OEX97_02015 [Acidimicrobiia bacterium]|nr:hypothetical protein [Acidimicrobiia bacterium]
MNSEHAEHSARRLVVDVASACSKLGTWGLDPDLRADILTERATDLTEQLADPARNANTVVMGRILRTLVGDMGRRISSHHVSALPLAVSLSIGGVGALLYAALIPNPDYRLSLLLEGTGFLMLAITGFRSPLAIRRFPAAAGSLVLASGTALGVAAIPFDDEVSLFAISAKTSLSLATIGFTALAIGLVTEWDRAPRLPGAIILVAAGLIVFSEIGWSLYIFDQDAVQVVPSMLVAGAGVLFFRFFGRLRHLPIE